MKELHIIKDLMDELCEKMQYGADDFSERLGRNKDSELKAMPEKDEGIMKKTGEHYGTNEKRGGKPEDMGVPVKEKGDPGHYGEVDEDEELRGRIMRLRA